MGVEGGMTGGEREQQRWRREVEERSVQQRSPSSRSWELLGHGGHLAQLVRPTVDLLECCEVPVSELSFAPILRFKIK